MGLLEEVKEAQSRHRQGQPCGVSLILENMEKSDRADLEEALSRDFSEVPHSTLARVLKQRGFTVSDQTISRHRREICLCHRYR